jgi:hypothetical protein
MKMLAALIAAVSMVGCVCPYRVDADDRRGGRLLVWS